MNISKSKSKNQHPEPTSTLILAELLSPVGTIPVRDKKSNAFPLPSFPQGGEDKGRDSARSRDKCLCS